MGETNDPNLLFAPLGNRTQIMISPPPLGFVGRIVRALRLRCPRCGRGRLFAGWFTMHDKCSECGLDLRREPGFYLGSIYINYGLTATFVTLAFCVLVPLAFFRYARSLWLSMDQFWDADANDS